MFLLLKNPAPAFEKRQPAGLYTPVPGRKTAQAVVPVRCREERSVQGAAGFQAPVKIQAAGFTPRKCRSHLQEAPWQKKQTR